MRAAGTDRVRRRRWRAGALAQRRHFGYRDARVVLDAYQAVGTMPIDVHALGADFLVGGCLKYLIGTAGVGFMYVRASRALPWRPTAGGWFAQQDIGAMDHRHLRQAATARRFEAGTPNVRGLHAARAGLEQILGVGLGAISAQISTLTAGIAARASERALQLVTPELPSQHGAMMAIRAHDAPALVEHLVARDVIVSERDGNLRVAPHFYNDESDRDRLFEALDAHPGLLPRA